MTRLYAFLAKIGAGIFALLLAFQFGKREARNRAKVETATYAAETSKDISDATIKHAGLSDDDIRDGLRKRKPNTR